MTKSLETLSTLETAASALPDREPASVAQVDAYQEAQRALWRELLAQGNPWRISDFVSVGTPMYFANQLMDGKDGRSFDSRIARRELPMCPPLNEESESNNINQTARFFSWRRASASPSQARPNGSAVG